MADPDAQPSFGQWLRQRRKSLDFTQVELAARVPCAKGTIRRLEAGDLRPSKQLAERMADVLGVVAEDRAAFIRFARGGSAEEADLPPLGVARLAVTTQQPAPVRRHMLPAGVHGLVGRQHAAEVAVELLGRPDVRLVTLVGPPGVGKTRLAHAVGAQIQQRFREGACLVELAPLRGPEHVLPAIAQAISLADSGPGLASALAERLRGEELLLLLDNFEHVIDAAPRVAALLAAAPALRVLCTSRVPLRIAGEQEFVVPPLALPDLSRPQPAAALEANPAVALFLARARAVHPGLTVTEASLGQIAEICRRLDGLPLAIELAATRARLFPPAALLSRLDHRLPFLTGGTRDAPARQRTLEAAIDWSYQLLGRDEQRCLARMGVFWGGATLAAVEAVCGEGLDALAALTALAEHCLVQPIHDERGETRFTMLETIREFALARLSEEPDAALVAARHARHALGLAIEGERGLQGAEQVPWMQRLSADENNLRAGLAWSLGEQGDLELGLRAGAGLWWFWWTNGQVGEGRRWLGQLLQAALERGLSDTGLYGRALLGAGILAFFGGELASALPQFAEARVLGEGQGDAITHGYATFMVGTVQVLTQQREEGYALIAEGSRLLRGAGEAATWHVGVTSLASALLLFERGDLDAAERQAETAMAIFRWLGQPYGIGLAYNYQGDVARLRGDLVTAAARYQAALPLLREARARSEIPAVLHNLGHVLLAEGDASQARALFAEGFELHREIGNRTGMAECLIGLAATLAALGRPRLAATLLGATEMLLATLNAPLFAAEQTAFGRAAAELRASLGAESWHEARLAGSALAPTEIARLVGDSSAVLPPGEAP